MSVRVGNIVYLREHMTKNWSGQGSEDLFIWQIVIVTSTRNREVYGYERLDHHLHWGAGSHPRTREVTERVRPMQYGKKVIKAMKEALKGPNALHRTGDFSFETLQEAQTSVEQLLSITPTPCG